MLFGIVFVGFVGALEPRAIAATGRGPASFTQIQHQYQTAWTNWASIPAECKGDLPVRDGRGDLCDRYWRAALIQGMLVLTPLVLMLFGFWFLTQSQANVYLEAQARVRNPKKAQAAKGKAEVIPDDLFSWLHGLKPAYATIEGKAVLVYLSCDAPELDGSERLSVYELGKIFGKVRKIAVIEQKGSGYLSASTRCA